MPKIDRIAVVYTNGSQECERVTSLIRSLGGEFQEYRLDQHFSQRAFEQEFGPDADYPQVAIGARHIGNLKETLQQLQQEGIIN